jgi:hypothetical protein
MSNKKISQLAGGGNLQNTDLLVIARSGQNYNVTAQQINSKISGISVATTNGFSADISAGNNPAITLKTTITGIIKGDGTALQQAQPGTDYLNSSSIIDAGTF